MSEIQLPIVITKKDCHRCIELKEWLKENELHYVEKDIDDEEFVQQLLYDPNFVGMPCEYSSSNVERKILV